MQVKTIIKVNSAKSVMTTIFLLQRHSDLSEKNGANVPSHTSEYYNKSKISEVDDSHNICVAEMEDCFVKKNGTNVQATSIYSSSLSLSDFTETVNDVRSPSNKIVMCPVGSKMVNTKSHSTHLRRHTDDRRFTCIVCSRTFSLAHHLTGHMLTHTGEKPFACDVCQRRFTASQSLKRHKFLHTGEKPFVCATCGHQFRSVLR